METLTSPKTRPRQLTPHIRNSQSLGHFILLSYTSAMGAFDRISRDPAVMAGKPCIRGTRVTVGVLVGLVASGRSNAEILDAFPYLAAEDIAQALSYAAWRAEEIEIPLPA